jgi:hypothetical protein
MGDAVTDPVAEHLVVGAAYVKTARNSGRRVRCPWTW